jgi:hypothetical protein
MSALELQNKLAKAAIFRGLDVNNMGLTELPSLPPNLLVLYCARNKLTRLPDLPSGLQKLSCSYNQLTTLPKLPNGLMELYCNGNKLTRLPILPKSLWTIILRNNNFTGRLKKLVDTFEKDKEEIVRKEFALNSISDWRAIENLRAQLPIITQNFIDEANKVHVYNEVLGKIKLAAAPYKYHPRHIAAAMARNKLNMNAPMTDETWNKYYSEEKGSEQWTEGVGQAYGPWQEGGKTRRRKAKKRKTQKRRTLSK